MVYFMGLNNFQTIMFSNDLLKTIYQFAPAYTCELRLYYELRASQGSFLRGGGRKVENVNSIL